MLPEDLDHERLAETSLALLSLTLHDYGRAWKTLDYELMALLHEKGWIEDPRNKAKSVFLTEEGERLAATFLKKHFGRRATGARGSKKKCRPTGAPGWPEQEIADPSRVHVIRCTAKLLRELRVEPAPALPDGMDELKDWHANLLLIDRRKCLLFTHSRTLYSFLVPGVKREDLNRFPEVFAENLAASLEVEGIERPCVEKLLSGPLEVAIAKTRDRRVLGSMNDLAFQAQAFIEHSGGVDPCDFIAMNQTLNRTLLGPLKYDQPINVLNRTLNEIGT